MGTKKTAAQIQEDFRLAEVAEGEARAFAQEWLSWDEQRMLAALEAPIRCPSRGCNHEYAPIEGIEFAKYPVYGQDIEKTSVLVRCPTCRGSGGTLLDNLNFRKRWFCCVGCGREAKTAPFRQRRQIGLIIMRLYSDERSMLCAPCMGRMYRSMTGVTLVAGWWGVISLFVTPYVLISNTAGYLGRPKSAGKPVGPWIDDRIPAKVRESLAPHLDWAIEKLNAPGRTASSSDIANEMGQRAGQSWLYAMLYLSQTVNERMRVLLEEQAATV